MLVFFGTIPSAGGHYGRKGYCCILAYTVRYYDTTGTALCQVYVQKRSRRGWHPFSRVLVPATIRPGTNQGQRQTVAVQVLRHRVIFCKAGFLPSKERSRRKEKPAPCGRWLCFPPSCTKYYSFCTREKKSDPNEEETGRLFFEAGN